MQVDDLACAGPAAIGSPLAPAVMGLVAARFGHVDPSDGPAVEKFFATLSSVDPQTQAAIIDEFERLCLASETDPAFRSVLGAVHEGLIASNMCTELRRQ